MSGVDCPVQIFANALFEMKVLSVNLEYCRILPCTYVVLGHIISHFVDVLLFIYFFPIPHYFLTVS